MPSSYSPKPDIHLLAADAKKLRNNITKFLPSIGLSMIDYGRSHDIDHFYLLCQAHRDYYKDFSGKMQKIHHFDFNEKHFASRPDPTSVYVWQPICYMKELRPVTYPITLERRGRPEGDDLKIKLNGKYNEFTCIQYKR